MVGLADVEEVPDGVLDLVLDDPLHDGDVEVTREHRRLRRRLRRLGSELRLHVRALGPETQLQLEGALDGDLGDPVHAEGDLHVGARVRRPHVAPEALHDTHFIRFDLEIAGEEKHDEADHERDGAELREVRSRGNRQHPQRRISASTFAERSSRPTGLGHHFSRLPARSICGPRE